MKHLRKQRNGTSQNARYESVCAVCLTTTSLRPLDIQDGCPL
jgi:hypothetical protein